MTAPLRTPSRATLAVAAAVVLAVVVLAGCMPGPPPLAAPASTDARTDARTVAETRTRLAGLRPGERDPRGPAYDRDAFGAAWADVDGNGCNQRDDVLLRDAEPGTTRTAPQGGCPHDVLAGTWVDPYTGARLVLDDLKDPAQAQAVQIDHVVPLAEAWRSGASAWSPARRRGFAGDLASLVAADGPTNAAKSDDDPAAWRPRQRFQCAYAVRWVDVKHRWDLAADPSEVAALAEMVNACRSG